MKKKTIFLIAMIAVLAYFMTNYASITGDAESQLKEEYTTLWADSTDDDFNKGMSCPVFNLGGELSAYMQSADYPKCAVYGNPAQYKRYEDNLFSLQQNYANAGSDYEASSNIVLWTQNPSLSLTTQKVFKGQEVVLLVDKRATTDCGSAGITLSSNVAGGNIAGGFSDKQQIIKLIPHTFDNSIYDVEINGVKTQEMNIGTGFRIRFDVTHGGGSCTSSATIMYIGYKAQYECDLADDEVWVQEQFSQPFDIYDLEFPPTKFCKETRPFVLRDIQEGETPIYPDPIPSFNRGDTIMVPSGKIVVVNYATPNVYGVTNRCPPDQANVKMGGIWVCSQVVEHTVETREIISREIIPISSRNSFDFSSTPTMPQFNFGNQIFRASESYKCPISDGEIIRPPNPSSSCYESAVSFLGQSRTMTDGDSYDFSNNINVQFFAVGEVKYADTENLNGVYRFTVDKTIGLDAEGGETIRHNVPATVKIKITNYLPKNSIMLEVQQKVKTTNQNLEERTFYSDVDSVAYIDVPIDTANLGVNEIGLQAFYNIQIGDNKISFPSDKMIIRVDINDGESIVEFVEYEKEPLNLVDMIVEFIRNLISKLTSLIQIG